MQILDLSYNRIRELRPRSFALFEDIKFLYLFDNMILSIEANTFSRMQSLEVRRRECTNPLCGINLHNV